MDNEKIKDEWDTFINYLPRDWQEMAYETGALIRKRKIDSPERLLRVLFIHLAEGKSLRTTAAYAKEVGLCDVNDTALFFRLRSADEWFRSMASGLIAEADENLFPDHFSKKFNIRLVDSTVITEPGSTGTDWRIHYRIGLNTLQCDYFHVTDPFIGESLSMYPVEKKDLLIADRGYCKRKGITAVLEKGGNVLVRFHSNNLPLFQKNGKPLDVLSYLEALAEDEKADVDVWFRSPQDGSHLIKGRICAVRKTEEAIAKSIAELKKKASKRGTKLRPETLEYAKYIILFTTVSRRHGKANELLDLYRNRWQIELVFKRLKSILNVGHLPKTESKSCMAWLHGKLLIALLVERLYREGIFFSQAGKPGPADTFRFNK